MRRPEIRSRATRSPPAAPSDRGRKRSRATSFVRWSRRGKRSRAATSVRAATRLSLLALAPLALVACGAPPDSYDLVIEGGRVVDPASGTDGVRSVAIRNGTVARVAEGEGLEARDTLDARGLAVAPGFIDLLAEYPEEDEGAVLKLHDGVTSMVAMQGGPADVAGWYRAREEGALLHFGTAAGLAELRQSTGVEDPERPATPEQIEGMVDAGLEALRAGAVGLGLGILQVQGASREEIFRLFQLAEAEGVPVHVRIRHFGDVAPATSGAAALQEVVAAAAASGASATVLHINSMLAPVRQMALGLELLEGARERGVAVGASAYPYTAASTGLHTPSFDPGWQERFGGIGYEDVELVSTGEPLTAERFRRYRQRDTVEVVVHYMPEESVERALVHPLVSVGSDGVIRGGRGHPRGAGTFARVLGRYVREADILTLPEAIRKMSLMPARELEGAVPAMARKGRLEPGADADIVVFDPERVVDRATFEEPGRPSTGMVHVLVAGEPVIRGGVFQEDVRAGRAIRREAGGPGEPGRE